MPPLPKNWKEEKPSDKGMPRAEPDEIHSPLIAHPYTPERLLRWGRERADAFVKANKLPPMRVQEVSKEKWYFDACAYWRKNECHICVPYCASVATERQARNWNWPGCPTDRTPYGAIAHELGHHCDAYMGDKLGLQRGSYFSGYSVRMRKESGEKRLTSYCPNDAEWFAEMFRLFVTNHALLYEIRPKTWELFARDWIPVSDHDWQAAIGMGCPDRIRRVLLRR